MTKTSCFLVNQIPAAKDNKHPDKKHLLLFKTPNQCPRKTKASAHAYHSPMRAKSSQDVMVNSWTGLTTICFEPDRGRAVCSGRSMQWCQCVLVRAHLQWSWQVCFGHCISHSEVSNKKRKTSAKSFFVLTPNTQLLLWRLNTALHFRVSFAFLLYFLIHTPKHSVALTHWNVFYQPK